MRLLLFALAAGLAACSTTPTDLLADAPPAPAPAGPVGAPDGYAVVSRSPFAGVGGHRVEGALVLYRSPIGRHVIRLEGLDAQGGPDLHVWLVQRFTGAVAEGHVTLGPLRSTRGDQNYDVPPGVDPAAFVGVSIWCEAFGVDFGHATL